MKKTAFIIVLLLGFFALKAQNAIVGKWITIDDNTLKTKSIVNIYKNPNGELYGKVIKIIDQKHGPNPICNKCTDDRKNKYVLGMQIIRNMKWDAGDKEWQDGTICDPENGKVYDCKLWIENGKLKVRGYILFLYRTQTWVRVKEN